MTKRLLVRGYFCACKRVWLNKSKDVVFDRQRDNVNKLWAGVVIQLCCSVGHLHQYSTVRADAVFSQLLMPIADSTRALVLH